MTTLFGEPRGQNAKQKGGAIMIPNMPAIGIRFDINKVESGAYGIESWKVFWQSVDPSQLKGALLFEGDTDATLRGEENVYCICIQSVGAPVLDEIRSNLEHSPEFGERAASPQFIENDQVTSEPLVDAGQIDSEGNLSGKSYNSGPALGAVQKERQPVASATPSAEAPERPKPASARTANLPAISSLKELEDFLLTNFGEKNKYQFWLTPEELCDIVERYADFLRVEWKESSCGLSHDMTYVTLFHKDKEGENKEKEKENIGLTGLFPFISEKAAKDYCYDRGENYDYLFGQLDALYGIQGKFSTNFSGNRYSNLASHHDEQRIDTTDLWPRITNRREALGISSSPTPAAAGSAQKKKSWQFWK